MRNFPQIAGIESNPKSVESPERTRAVLSPSAASDLAPFEGELRTTFGAALAELPVRALQFARGAASASGRDDAFDRAQAVGRLLLLQGAEAGAHRGSWADDEDPPLPLEDLLARSRHDLPRWAAGGLMTASDVRRVLDLGASAAVMGTAFLLCPEAGTSTTHRKALQDRQFTETALTRAFTGRTARGLVNTFLRQHTEAPRGYPEVHHLTRPLRQAAAAQGDPDAVHLWAGTGWQQCQALSAGELTRSLAP